MDWKFDICKLFECTPEVCIKRTRRNCEGKFWERTCVLRGDHLNLNENKSEFIQMRMAEDTNRYERWVELNKALGK